jgi:hypothetical protein
VARATEYTGVRSIAAIVRRRVCCSMAKGGEAREAAARLAAVASDATPARYISERGSYGRHQRGRALHQHRKHAADLTSAITLACSSAALDVLPYSRPNPLPFPTSALTTCHGEVASLRNTDGHDANDRQGNQQSSAGGAAPGDDKSKKEKASIPPISHACITCRRRRRTC